MNKKYGWEATFFDKEVLWELLVNFMVTLSQCDHIFAWVWCKKFLFLEECEKIYVFDPLEPFSKELWYFEGAKVDIVTCRKFLKKNYRELDCISAVIFV